MKRKKFAIIAALALIFVMLLSGCNEVEVGESGWTPSRGDPKVQTQPTATVEQMAAFGAYPNTIAASSVATIFKNIKIDDVTGLWVEEETEIKDKEGNVTGVSVARYDLQTGYYVYQLTTDGETVTTYYAKQGNQYFLVQEIQWIILAEEGDCYVLISREVLDAKPFLDDYGVSVWAESTVRDWLNGTGDYALGGEKYVESWNFYDRAFSEAEKSSIVTVSNHTDGNADYSTEGGADTEDKVYFFSADELAKYFTNVSAQASCTPFAASRGVKAEYRSRGANWWLRNPGINTFFQGVDRNGDLIEGGYSASDATVGVRPVIKVKKAAVREIDTTLPTAGALATPTPRPTAKPTDKPE